MPPVVPLLIGGILLLVVNLAVYLDRMSGGTRACRSARDFCALSFGFFLAAIFALLDLTTQFWIDPQENLALAALKITGCGLVVSTGAAIGFLMVARVQARGRC